jgi:hypothetical protein
MGLKGALSRKQGLKGALEKIVSKALCKRDKAQRCVIQKARASRHTQKKIVSKALCKRD